METAYQLQSLVFVQHYKSITHTRCYINAEYHYPMVFSWDCRRRRASWWPEQACPDRTNELQQQTNEACAEEPSEFAPRPPHHLVILQYLLAQLNRSPKINQPLLLPSPIGITTAASQRLTDSSPAGTCHLEFDVNQCSLDPNVGPKLKSGYCSGTQDWSLWLDLAASACRTTNPPQTQEEETCR